MPNWTPDLATGVDLIDIQHQELFNRINSLVTAIKEGKCKYMVSSVITFLEEYVIVHFGEEEALMRAQGYPEYEQHREQHGIFLQNLSDLRKELEEAGPSYVVSVSTNQVVVDWIIAHISTIDRKLGAFLVKQTVKSL